MVYITNATFINISINKTIEALVNVQNLCPVYCINLQYNVWISFMFLCSLFIIVNTRFNLTRRLAKNIFDDPLLIAEFDQKIINQRIVAYFVLANIVMFFLQFHFQESIVMFNELLGC